MDLLSQLPDIDHVCGLLLLLFPRAARPPPHPQANKHFDKEAALREAENVVKAQKAAYVKDDFFDMMSCETLDKMGQGDTMQHRRTMQVCVAVEQ